MGSLGWGLAADRPTWDTRLSTPHFNPSPDAQSSGPATTESLGWQLRAALPPLRLHSLSVYDLEGEVLWLSEGALGPDEHNLVIEALASLGDDPSIAYREDELEDGRAAVLLAARSPRAGLAGIVMILVDSKSLAAGSLAARVLVPPVHGILERLAVLLSAEASGSAASSNSSASASVGSQTRTGAGASSRLALEPTTVDELLTVQVAKEPPRGEDLPASTATGVWRALPANGGTGQWPAPLSPSSSAEWRAPPSPGATGVSGAPAAAVAKAAPSPVVGVAETSVQEFLRLRSGTRTRRYLVLPGSSIEATGNTAVNGVLLESAAPPSGAVRMLATTLKEVTAWLAAHRPLLEHVPIGLSVTIDARALAAEELPDVIAEYVPPARVRPGTVGFDIAEALCLRYRPHTARLLRRLEALGCSIALDDFVFDSNALELLRCKALRMVKVHGGLIGGVSRDRLCQARAVAIAQAARVLGVHALAKGVEDKATCRWLTWAGFELAEGPLCERPTSLASLGALLAAAD